MLIKINFCFYSSVLSYDQFCNGFTNLFIKRTTISQENLQRAYFRIMFA